jgi:glycosyltransferase A (GT-A) superfamily protein (DUF2064 family)
MTGIAFVIFVKTPDLSPIKTRLAKVIGKESAELFYLKSLEATAEVVTKVCKLNSEVKPYWAVAESLGLDNRLWNQFETIYQGEGSLGERLHHVYHQLIQNYSIVCFIGADSPHVYYQDYLDAIKIFKNNSCGFVLGNTLDGGFYFFAGKNPISKSVWTSVAYSTDQTSKQLSLELNKIAKIETVKTNFDIDELSDLLRYHDLLLDDDNLLEHQKELINWVNSLHVTHQT